MSFYNNPDYYGNSDYYGPGAGGTVPIDLDYYRTDVDNIYVFHWTFPVQYFTTIPQSAIADYELQLDTSLTFTSPNFQSFRTGTALAYQNGNVRKGFAVTVYPRVDGTTTTFYARVRIVFKTIFGDFSNVLTVQTLPLTVLQTANQLLSNLPDEHVYPVNESNAPLAQRTTNISKMYQGYATQFDLEFLEKEHVIEDQLIRRVRDERISAVFGSRFGFQKPSTMQFVDYRGILKALKAAVFMGSTYQAIILIGTAFTGVSPIIDSFSSLLNFITAGTTSENHLLVNVGLNNFTLNFLSSNCPTIPGFIFTPNSPPSTGQFTVNFTTGVVTINTAIAPRTITATYSPIPQTYTYLNPSSPPILYSRQQSGFGVKIIIQNPEAFVIDLNLITFIMKKVLPTNIYAVITTS